MPTKNEIEMAKIESERDKVARNGQLIYAAIVLIGKLARLVIVCAFVYLITTTLIPLPVESVEVFSYTLVQVATKAFEIINAKNWTAYIIIVVLLLIIRTLVGMIKSRNKRIGELTKEKEANDAYKSSSNLNTFGETKRG